MPPALDDSLTSTPQHASRLDRHACATTVFNRPSTPVDIVSAREAQPDLRMDPEPHQL